MKEKVIILGGGIIGLATAFELKKRDYDVTLLEKTSCGGQASGAAAGMLAPFSEIGEDPDDFFTFCLDSLRMYERWISDVKKASNVDFEFTNCGSLYAVYHEADVLALETRRAWQSEFGAVTELIEGEALRKLEPNISEEVVAAIYYPEESHVFTPDYVKALEVACRLNGVNIYDHLEETTIVEWENDICVEAKDGRRFSGDRLIICSGAWSSELEETFSLRIPVFPIRGQICAYENVADKLNHIIFTSQGYVVAKANGTIVNGASEDVAGFDTSVTDKGIERLTNWNKRILPFLGKMTPFHKWAGLRPATQDGFPLIGELSSAPHVIFATGHYRNGILLSPKTAVAVADLVDGGPIYAPLESFDPERFTY